MWNSKNTPCRHVLTKSVELSSDYCEFVIQTLGSCCGPFIGISSQSENRMSSWVGQTGTPPGESQNEDIGIGLSMSSRLYYYHDGLKSGYGGPRITAGRTVSMMVRGGTISFFMDGKLLHLDKVIAHHGSKQFFCVTASFGTDITVQDKVQFYDSCVDARNAHRIKLDSKNT